MLQVLTPFSDGVPSLTQCSIPPGGSMTYSFRASNAGTYWYHVGRSPPGGQRPLCTLPPLTMGRTQYREH